MRFEYKPTNSTTTILFTTDKEEACQYAAHNKLGIHLLDSRTVNIQLGARCHKIVCSACPLEPKNFPNLNVMCSLAAQYLLNKLSRYSTTKAFHG